MTVDELLKVVREEQLDAPVLAGTGALHLDAVVMEPDGSGWKVFLVDERHTTIKSTVRVFSEESAALDHVLLKLRQVQRSRR